MDLARARLQHFPPAFKDRELPYNALFLQHSLNERNLGEAKSQVKRAKVTQSEIERMF